MNRRGDSNQPTTGRVAFGHATLGVGPIGVVSLVLLALALWSAPAMAHVSSDPAAASGTTDDAGITTVVLSFDHGCGESPTTGLRVQLPDGTTDVTTADPDGWTSAVSDGVVTWTGGSVAPKDKGSFELRARLVGQEGEVIYLPTVQTCPDGEEAWIEIPVDGAEPEAPAPAVTLTRTVAPAGDAGGTGTTAADGSTTTAGPGTTRVPGTASTLLSTGVTTVGPAAGSSPGTTGLIIFIAVLVIIGGGAIVLYLRNRRPRGDSA